MWEKEEDLENAKELVEEFEGRMEVEVRIDVERVDTENF